MVRLTQTVYMICSGTVRRKSKADGCRTYLPSVPFNTLDGGGANSPCLKANGLKRWQKKIARCSRSRIGRLVYQETEIDDGRISPAETTGLVKGPLSGIVADLIPIGGRG